MIARSLVSIAVVAAVVLGSVRAGGVLGNRAPTWPPHFSLAVTNRAPADATQTLTVRVSSILRYRAFVSIWAERGPGEVVSNVQLIALSPRGEGSTVLTLKPETARGALTLKAREMVMYADEKVFDAARIASLWSCRVEAGSAGACKP